MAVDKLAFWDTFEYDGVVLEVVKQFGCRNCYFKVHGIDCHSVKIGSVCPPCGNRTYNDSVTFIKVESKKHLEEVKQELEPIKPKVDPNLAIGETFEYNNSFYQVKLADRNYNYGECNGCSFRNRKDPHSCVSIRERGLRPNCYYTKRNDETRVIFKKVYDANQDSQPKTIITSTPTGEIPLYKNHPIPLPLNTKPKVVNGEHKEVSLFKRIKIRIFNLI